MPTNSCSFVVFKVCFTVALFTIVVLLAITRVRHVKLSFPFLLKHNVKASSNNNTWTSWSRAVSDGRWYNFSHPPLFFFYVYSAFLVDDAIHLVSISSPVELFARRRLDILCVVRYRDGRPPHVASILRPPPRRITEHGRVDGYQVGDYVYSCPLTGSREDTVPSELSIVYKTGRAVNATATSVFMPIESPQRGDGNRSSIVGVAICVQATYGHIDSRRLVEWFEIQRLLGTTHVGVYITPATHPDTRRTLDYYDTTRLVELRTIDYLDGKMGGGHFLKVNLAAINDCIYRHLYTHRYVAVIDFDEVIIPRRHRNLVDMMIELDSKFQPSVANYVFLNAYFFTESTPDSNVSSDFTVARFLHRAAVNEYPTASKSIIVPQYCSSMHYHKCSEFADPSPTTIDNRHGERRRPGLAVVAASDAVSQHYRPCYTAFDTATCYRLLVNTVFDDAVLRYRHQLVDNVRRVLNFGMLYYDNGTATALTENATASEL